MARTAARRRDTDDTYHTPGSTIDPDSGFDDEHADLSAFIALSLPRVSDRHTAPASREERAAWPWQ